MASKDDLEAQFGPGSMAKDDLLTEATSLCRMYGLTAEELFWKWEAFILSATHLHAQASNAINKARVAPSFNLENARELRKEIQMAIKVPAVKQEPGVGTPKPAFKKPPGRGVDSLLANLATPTAKHKRPAVNTTPYTGSKPTPRPSHLVKTEFSDELGTPAKAGPSRFADISAATPTLVKTEFRPPAPSTFESRTNALEVVECLNAHLAAHTPPAATGPRVKLQTTADPKSYNYRYMFEKIMDRSEALDNRIDECAEVLKVAYQLKDDDLGDPSVESQEDMYAVGRICTDVHATKLQDAADRNKTSIWLESSRMMGGGNRMELRFDAEVVVRGSEAADGGASLFPGEILGVKGRNVGGQFFQVSELLMMPPSYLPVSTPQDLYSYQYESTKNSKLSGMPFAVMLACGPFTTEDNLDYAPLDALVEEARVSKPDVLVLLGPFIDMNHHSIRTGDIDQSLVQLHREQILSRLNSLSGSSPATTCILIPAIRDMLSHNVVFPQGPLDKELGLKKVRMLPNPAIFSINEVVFAVTSVDALMPIKAAEYVRDAKRAAEESEMELDDVPRDAISRVCRHVLRQRIIYPTFPAPLPGAGLELVNLDVTHMDLLKLGEGGVDVAILPSSLGKHFVKVVDSSIVVNPSLLTKASAGGTFARFTIYPMDKQELKGELRSAQSDPNLAIEHKVWERSKVEIIRI